MLANHCGTLPLDFVTNRFPSQSLFMFNVHVHIPTYSHVMCVECVCCVCAFAVHIFIKIAPNRIFPRSKHVAYVRIINLENRMMKKFGSGWKQQQQRVQNNKAMPYMCKLFGILHIIYKQTIDTLVFVLSLSFSPSVPLPLLIFRVAGCFHICNYQQRQQRQIPIMHIHHIISRSLLFASVCHPVLTLSQAVLLMERFVAVLLQLDAYRNYYFETFLVRKYRQIDFPKVILW